MKEPYGEGAQVDGVLSREISGNQDADAVYSAGWQHWWVRHREHLLELTRSETPDTHGTSTREKREALVAPDTKRRAGRSRPQGESGARVN
jgi:hypothetical protein